MWTQEKCRATPGSSGAEDRPDNGLINAQPMILSGRSASFDKRNDLDDDSVIDSNDDAEEDSLTIAQLLNGSIKINSFENKRDVGDEQVTNTVTSKMMASAICTEATKKSNCTSEPVEPNELIMPPKLCEESKSSAEIQSGPKEDAVLTRGLKFNNQPLEVSVHSMPSSENGKKRKSFTKRQTEIENFAVLSSEDNIVKHSMHSSDNGKKRKVSTERQPEVEEYAVVSSEDNIINLEDESFDDTTMESQPMGLKARIWRLEKILDMIKVAKGASSTGNSAK